MELFHDLGLSHRIPRYDSKIVVIFCLSSIMRFSVIPVSTRIRPLMRRDPVMKTLCERMCQSERMYEKYWNGIRSVTVKKYNNMAPSNRGGGWKCSHRKRWKANKKWTLMSMKYSTDKRRDWATTRTCRRARIDEERQGEKARDRKTATKFINDIWVSICR